jgi:hypothetical protein
MWQLEKRQDQNHCHGYKTALENVMNLLLSELRGFQAPYSEETALSEEFAARMEGRRGFPRKFEAFSWVSRNSFDNAACQIRHLRDQLGIHSSRYSHWTLQNIIYRRRASHRNTSHRNRHECTVSVPASITGRCLSTYPFTLVGLHGYRRLLLLIFSNLAT